MIEIKNVKPLRKGSLLAVCDVRIVPWQITIHDVKIFQKGINTWINLPSVEFTTKTGEVKHKDMVSFDNDDVLKRFRNQVMPYITSYLDKNPDLEPEPVITESAELPF